MTMSKAREEAEKLIVALEKDYGPCGEPERELLIHMISLALEAVEKRGAAAAVEFETGVGKVKCHDDSSVVFFNTFPDASNYVGKRLRVRIDVVEKEQSDGK